MKDTHSDSLQNGTVKPKNTSSLYKNDRQQVTIKSTIYFQYKAYKRLQKLDAQKRFAFDFNYATTAVHL